MQLDEQRFLDLVEQTSRLATVDIESSGLRGDYNNILVVSIKPYGKKPYSFQINQAGHDQKVVREAKEELEKYDAWITYYGKGFDLPMINTRLLKWGLKPVEKRPHIDLYFTLKYNLLTARKSLAHLVRWLKLQDQKMDVGADDWVEASANPQGKAMKLMVSRCESDVTITEELYKKTRHLIREIKK